MANVLDAVDADLRARLHRAVRDSGRLLAAAVRNIEAIDGLLVETGDLRDARDLDTHRSQTRCVGLEQAIAAQQMTMQVLSDSLGGLPVEELADPKAVAECLRDVRGASRRLGGGK